MDFDIIGNVLLSKDLKIFAFQCLCCDEKIVGDAWSEFAQHINDSHVDAEENEKFTELDIKQEEDNDDDSSQECFVENEELMDIEQLTDKNHTITTLSPQEKLEKESDADECEKIIDIQFEIDFQRYNKSQDVKGVDAEESDAKDTVEVKDEVEDEDESDKKNSSDDNESNVDDNELFMNPATLRRKQLYNKAVKNLTFAKMSPFTLAFIEEYGKHQILYDEDERQNMSQERRELYKKISQKLSEQFKFDLTPRDVQYGIYFVRDWYYMSTERRQKDKNGGCQVKKKYRRCSPMNQLYLEKCSFLPPRRAREKYVCDICGKLCYNRTGRQIHMYNAHQIGELPYKCDTCGQPFKHKSTMELHRKRAHSEKCHICPHCAKGFAVLNDMERHIRQIHLGERNYICENCGRAFRYALELTNHIASAHTKIRAHECSMCPRAFFTGRDLKDHMKGHLNIRDKICHICGKAFTNGHALCSHRQTHFKYSKIKCPYCPSDFAEPAKLREHVRKMHSQSGK